MNLVSKQKFIPSTSPIVISIIVFIVFSKSSFAWVGEKFRVFKPKLEICVYL